ncbi:YlmC/YmxH family sporulation protein [Salimicrobium halophilum]|uniref:Sporulation protein, YlmC/YmxH family n=1 Tax=Salimicrobium halophilum TaxID=86666 RepID=A0A1G8QFJ7_9BACI|nr:YlmC/YmxH family sporulation protein [Salimicrobium halophilum]SDJ03408.1 sporulation protein, YlmC/YmxH family [Salimicrobium halophilum]
MKITDLQLKDVIAVESGERLGFITDVDIDTKTGRLASIELQLKGKTMGLFGKEEAVQVKWEQIVNIGADVILVNIKGTEPK